MFFYRLCVPVVSILISCCILGCEKKEKLNNEIDEAYSETNFKFFDQQFGEISALLNTYDNNLVVIGESDDIIGRTFRMIKLNPHSDIIWLRSFLNQQIEGGHTIIENWKGELFVAGFSAFLADGISDAVVLKTGASGASKWSQKFGGEGEEVAECLVPANDEYYIVAGQVINGGEQDLFIGKIDDQGDIESTKSIDLYSEDEAHSLHSTDEGYVISCLSKIDSLSESIYDIKYLSLIKLDDDLNLLWERTHYTTQWDSQFDLIETKDNRFLAIGSTPYKIFDQDDNPEVQLMKLNAEGQQLWVQTYGGSRPDLGVTACELKDYYYTTGKTWSYGNGSADIFVLKTDRSGQLEWFKTYGGKHFEGPGDILTSDWDLDELIIGGNKADFETNDKDVFLLTIDDTGEPQ